MKKHHILRIAEAMLLVPAGAICGAAESARPAVQPSLPARADIPGFGKNQKKWKQ